MKISILGLGYIGLPTALIIASKNNNKVFGYDINKELIKRIISKEIIIKEKGMNELLDIALKNNNFSINQKLHPADVYMICVGTPYNENKNSIDLTNLIQAIREINKILKKGDIIIIESTLNPGTTRKIIIPIIEETGLEISKDIFFALCPERVLPGNLLYEMEFNDRIIGTKDKMSEQLVEKLYNTIIKGEIHKTTIEMAEMIKLVENTFRMVNIAFSNEIAQICNCLNLNVFELIKLANNHPRVNLLQPGPGVGGYCLTKDPLFLSNIGNPKIINAAINVNRSMSDFVISKVENMFKNNVKIKIGILGISYKANVSDIRESPGIIIGQKLIAKGYQVTFHDPFFTEIEGLIIENNIENLFRKVQLIIIITNHDEYREINWSQFPGKIFDTRNIIKQRHPQIKKL